MLLYWCTKEAEDGTCMPDGVRVDVLSRSRRPPPENINRLLTSLPSVCLFGNNMQTVSASDACGRRPSELSDPVPLSPCAVNLLPAHSFHPDQLSGLWYEIGHNVLPQFSVNKNFVFYKPLPGQRLSSFSAIEMGDNWCVGPLKMITRPRCLKNPNGRWLTRIESHGNWLWGSWQLLYFQQNVSVIHFFCHDEGPDGSCSTSEFNLVLLSREPNPSPEVRQQLKSAIDQLGCFDHVNMEELVYEGTSCRPLLDPVMQDGA
ncbi:hypothetical protein C0Q70_17452 [Pomacea canaliculata]|uniref:Lipocalin/cytosolic fatty-acid binding domain-containing protein n=2 Tax=Pomacea canaliculata TaxID=400727 RepID=A0A2T7NKG1_POMCA|nr:hypothetical protein C0Q70_17452 [Pomacea canaliculata]